MKYIKLFLLITFTLCLGACSEDDLDSKSIFDTEEPKMNEFDNWLMKNYVTPYNISFNYRYDDKEFLYHLPIYMNQVHPQFGHNFFLHRQLPAYSVHSL